MMESNQLRLPDPTRVDYGEFNKSSRTRRQLLHAAMTHLAEEGFSNFSAGAIASRVNFTRAALLYHFPNRAALIEAVVYFVVRKRIEIYEQAMSSLSLDEKFGERLIEHAWDHLQDDSFKAFCELSTIARSNQELNKIFQPALNEYDRMRRQLAFTYFPESLLVDPTLDLRRDLVRYLLEGLAQQRGMSYAERERTENIMRLIRELVTTKEGEGILSRAVNRQSALEHELDR